MTPSENQRRAAEEACEKMRGHLNHQGWMIPDEKLDAIFPKVMIPAIALLLASRESAAAYAGGKEVLRSVEEEFKKWSCIKDVHAAGCKCDLGIVCMTAAKQAAENLKPV